MVMLRSGDAETGHLSQNSVSESGNFGLKIAAGESSVLTEKQMVLNCLKLVHKLV